MCRTQCFATVRCSCGITVQAEPVCGLRYCDDAPHTVLRDSALLLWDHLRLSVHSHVSPLFPREGAGVSSHMPGVARQHPVSLPIV